MKVRRMMPKNAGSTSATRVITKRSTIQSLARPFPPLAPPTGGGASGGGRRWPYASRLVGETGEESSPGLSGLVDAFEDLHEQRVERQVLYLLARHHDVDGVGHGNPRRLHIGDLLGG